MTRGWTAPRPATRSAPLGPWVTAFTGGAPLDCPQFPAGPPPDGVYNLVAMLNYQPNVPITTGRETWVISGGGTRLDAVQQTELGIDHWTEQLNTASGSFMGATICGDQGIRIEDYCFNSSILTLDSGAQIARYERQLP